MEQPNVMELTAEIVSAHVSNNTVAAGDVAMLVRSVHEALSGIGRTVEPVLAKMTPAVSVKSSVKPDYITCLVCGRKQKTMRRHLEAAHNMTAEAYRAEFFLPKSYPMVAPEYSQRRGDMARRIGLGRKPEAPAAPASPRPSRSRRSSRSNELPAPAAAAPSKAKRSRKGDEAGGPRTAGGTRPARLRKREDAPASSGPAKAQRVRRLEDA